MPLPGNCTPSRHIATSLNVELCLGNSESSPATTFPRENSFLSSVFAAWLPSATDMDARDSSSGAASMPRAVSNAN